MAIDTLRRLLAFIVLCLAQVLVLGRIQLFHVATPLLYVYFVIAFPRGYPRWGVLLWAFAMGLVLDTFANTPGIAAAALTLVGFLQPSLIELFLPRDAEENIKASAQTLGGWRFASLAAILTVVHCLVFFTIEAFSYHTWLYSLQCAFASALLTFAMIMALESLRRPS